MKIIADAPPVAARRRGVVLILVLGLLALVALVAIALLVLSAQARNNSRRFALSLLRPDPEDLMFFGLSQLVRDTSDPLSAIRGHSLLKDMYGNDSYSSGFLARHPGASLSDGPQDPQFYVLAAQFEQANGLWQFRTSIRARDPAFYGYNFTRWIMRFRDQGVKFPHPVDQSVEILIDDDSGASAFSDGNRVFCVSEPDSTTVLENPTLLSTTPLSGPLHGSPFVLDGRFLHAFNGSGLGSMACYGNFRINGGLLAGDSKLVAPGDPDAVGMDEDYDACDLENWFLAMQGAGGDVVVPSFHRPAIIRADPEDPGYPNNPAGPATPNDWRNTSPDSAARFLRPRSVDGHDPLSFPDLLPDLKTGKLEFDVDNDNDGTTDSVWLDLGYPSRLNTEGKLYKPLFSFLVLGLNGRIPLNTAGNLADLSDAVAGPRHAAHLGNSVSEVDPTYALQNAPDPTGTRFTQADNAGVDVRLTQLRNLLTGTRHHSDPLAPEINSQNGDANFVLVGGTRYYLPNNIADSTDVHSAASPDEVLRSTSAIAGRWGEAELVPGTAQNPVRTEFNNLIRAGRSFLRFDPLTQRIVRWDAGDDNFSTFDPYPEGPLRRGEVGDMDLYDRSGSVVLPVERMRRFVTPVDVDGSGQVVRWNQWNNALGPDRFGRIGFLNYFRPPGSPGIVTADGSITSREANSAAADITNNLYHGFESLRIPNVTFGTPRQYGGAPVNVGDGTVIPTYDVNVNGQAGSRALDEADELNAEEPKFGDNPFHAPDLEWLYRHHDHDGHSLSSRLAKLAPVSFTNPVDGLRRRRLFSIDSWEQATFVWANDNPGNAFWNNSRFRPGANASFANLNVTAKNIAAFPAYPWRSFNPAGAPSNPNVLGSPGVLRGWPVATPALAHGGRKINLNIPLPISNRPDEPIRIKWIRETYELLKAILPPRAVDTPLELAQLSQFVINLVDHRDPDATMTRFVNQDISASQVVSEPGSEPPSFHPPRVAFADPPGSGNLVQFGMEFAPVAINEVLSYSFDYKATMASQPAPQPVNRLFVELVNTLTETSAASTASQLDLSGWKMIILPDDPRGRPDPVTGQIPAWAPDAVVTLPNRAIAAEPVPIAGTAGEPGLPVPLLPLRTTAAGADGERRYYYVIGNAPPAGSIENPPMPTPDCVLPDSGSASMNEQVLLDQLPAFGSDPAGGDGRGRYLWLYLLRPANPFDSDSPLVAVDSVRFAMLAGGGKATTDAQGVDRVTPGANPLYSIQRLQPLRGGQLVPGAPGASDYAPMDAYGFSEQTSTPSSGSSQSVGRYGDQDITEPIEHTLGKPNRPAEIDWDYVPFLDRDFTSLAEVLLVPRSAPGLFTKKFVEQAPPIPDPPAAAPFLAPPLNRPAPLRTPADAIPQTYPYLADEFFYTGAPESAPPHWIPTPPPDATYVGGPGGAGWYKMLEFLEVPSRSEGSTGPVSQGMNFDAARRDRRPGLVNLNLIIDEEVFLSVMGRQPLNFRQTPAAGDSLPRVVTMTDFAGTPVASYPLSNRGFFTADPLMGEAMDSRLKAAFVEFLRIRHGGSGYLFAFGSGAVGTPNPAVDLPNNLEVAAERPFRSLSFPDINATVLRPAALPPSAFSSQPALDVVLPAGAAPVPFVWDPGVKNPYFLPAAGPGQPPPIPARWLFQIPDHYSGTSPSNASESGDPSVNTQTSDGNLGSLTGGRVNLVALPADQSAYLGSGATPDRRQSPYFRSEWLQSVMNLTTVRTHQFAVWMTIGYFEVKRQGKPTLALTHPSRAVDLLGREIGLPGATRVRHRAFFVVDRSRAFGSNPAEARGICDSIVHSNFVQ